VDSELTMTMLLLPTLHGILFPAKLITAILHPPPPNKNFLVRKWKMEDTEFSIFRERLENEKWKIETHFSFVIFTVDEKWKMCVHFPFFIFELR